MLLHTFQINEHIVNNIFYLSSTSTLGFNQLNQMTGDVRFDVRGNKIHQKFGVTKSLRKYVFFLC